MTIETLATATTTTQRYPLEKGILQALSATIDDASAAIHARLRVVIKKGGSYVNPLQLAEGWVSGYKTVHWFGRLPLDPGHDTFLELVARNDTGAAVQLNLNWRLADA